MLTDDIDTLREYFKEFAVYFPAVNVVVWTAIYFAYNPKGGKKNSFTSALLFFICVNFSYIFTSNISDRIYLSRPAADRSPLYDLGFRLTPEVVQLQLFCDFFAAASMCAICFSCVCVLRDMKSATDGVRDITVGKLVSLSLHTFTQYPDSRSPGFENGFPLFGYQGLTDRLMSNHIYELGVALHVLSVYQPRFGSAPRLTLLVAYTLAMICSRGHYTADCVVAWWTLLAVGRIHVDPKVHKPKRMKPGSPLTFDEKFGWGFMFFIMCCSALPKLLETLGNGADL